MGLRVNFTGVSVGDTEAKPNGWYHVAVSDVEVKKAGEKAKNPGAEYWQYELTIQSGELTGRKFWTNANLMPNALFTLKGMMTIAKAARMANKKKGTRYPI